MNRSEYVNRRKKRAARQAKNNNEHGVWCVCVRVLVTRDENCKDGMPYESAWTGELKWLANAQRARGRYSIEYFQTHIMGFFRPQSGSNDGFCLPIASNTPQIKWVFSALMIMIMMLWRNPCMLRTIFYATMRAFDAPMPFCVKPPSSCINQ